LIDAFAAATLIDMRFHFRHAMPDAAQQAPAPALLIA
jgi:hypothetical protein